MSSILDNISCPHCGEEALAEHNNTTNKTHVWCNECHYDSDDTETEKDETDGTLSDKQIEHWRKILSATLGPYAYMMPKEEVQKMKDSMQKVIDSNLT